MRGSRDAILDQGDEPVRACDGEAIDVEDSTVR
jgi:hypothetical protein